MLKRLEIVRLPLFGKQCTVCPESAMKMPPCKLLLFRALWYNAPIFAVLYRKYLKSGTKNYGGYPA